MRTVAAIVSEPQQALQRSSARLRMPHPAPRLESTFSAHDFSRIPLHSAEATGRLGVPTVYTGAVMQAPGIDRRANGRLQRVSDDLRAVVSYDQRIAQELWEKREAGQLASGVNFEATAADLPPDADIAFDLVTAQAVLKRERAKLGGKENIERLGWEGKQQKPLDSAAAPFYPYVFRWVQTVSTNDPLNPKIAAESVDGEARNGIEPYYYKHGANEKGPGKFEDYPSRRLTDNRTIEWSATLALVGVEQRNQRLEAYDVTTYGFRLSPETPLTKDQLANRETPFHKVDQIHPKQDWSAFSAHREVVEAAFPAWSYSLLKAKPGAAEKSVLRLLLGLEAHEEPQL